MAYVQHEPPPSMNSKTERIITYHIWPRDLSVADLITWTESFAQARDLTDEMYVFHQLTIDKYDTTKCTNTAQLAEILNYNKSFQTLLGSSTYTGANGRFLEWAITISKREIKVSFCSDDVDLLHVAHSAIKDKFMLRNPSIPSPDSARARDLHATIFLGRHFDETAKTVSAPLLRFFQLVGFDVVEGEEFTAQAISAKVKSRIDLQDIYVGLVTGNREHDWITAEAGYALGKGKHLIILVEEGSNFSATITGKDFEHIPFQKGAVEQTFVKLLEEFRSIRVCGLFS